MKEKFDSMVKSFAGNRERVIGGLVGIDERRLEPIVEMAQEEIAKRMGKSEWNQADLDRLTCAFATLSLAAELDKRSR